MTSSFTRLQVHKDRGLFATPFLVPAPGRGSGRIWKAVWGSPLYTEHVWHPAYTHAHGPDTAHHGALTTHSGLGGPWSEQGRKESVPCDGHRGREDDTQSVSYTLTLSGLAAATKQKGCSAG